MFLLFFVVVLPFFIKMLFLVVFVLCCFFMFFCFFCFFVVFWFFRLKTLLRGGRSVDLGAASVQTRLKDPLS